MRRLLSAMSLGYKPQVSLSRESSKVKKDIYTHSSAINVVRGERPARGIFIPS